MSKIVTIDGRPAGTAPVLVSPTGQAVGTQPQPVAPVLPPVSLKPFDKAGYVMKVAEDPDPEHKGQFLLHNKDGVILGVCNRPDVAVMLCEAMRLLFLAQMAAKAEREANPVAGAAVEGLQTKV